MPAITVVVTTYNLEQYMDRCLGELHGQTMRDFEVLVVDDASTDGTAAIVEAWKPRFNGRLQSMYRPENSGCSACGRNAALDSGRIRGDYVLFLDGDDRIENTMLETLHARAVSDAAAPADVAICAFDRVDAETGRVFSTEMQKFPEELRLPPHDDTIAFINTAPWNKLWRRELVEDVRFSTLKVGEELVFNLQAYLKAKKLVFTDDILIHYTVRADSAIAHVREQDIWDFAAALLDFSLRRTGPDQELVGFLAFLHIGLSMALRAADNAQTDLARHLADTARHFRDHYNWFRGNRFLTLASLKKHRLKGVLIWLALQAYRHGWFGPALACYRKLGLHIKF